MDLKDKFALQELRKAAGTTIPDSAWEQVEKESESLGVLGLTGTSQQIVSSMVFKGLDLMKKHAVHNQKTHGNGRNGRPEMPSKESVATDYEALNLYPDPEKNKRMSRTMANSLDNAIKWLYSDDEPAKRSSISALQSYVDAPDRVPSSVVEYAYAALEDIGIAQIKR